jgi:hypothetical protein
LDAIVGKRITAGDESVRGFGARGTAHVAPVRRGPASIFTTVNAVVVKELFVVGIFIHAVGGTRARGTFVRKTDLFTGT